MDTITPCLWFDTEAQAAADFYTAVFEDSGPQYQLSEAISFMVPCKSQLEVDRYREQLTDGGEEGPCGWLKDRFGVSWQVFPKRMIELLGDPDPGRAQRATDAMMAMRKIDLALIEEAAGAPA